ncbi:hypothetical protein BLOT_004993, partial [Blomia tropicalis]
MKLNLNEYAIRSSHNEQTNELLYGPTNGYLLATRFPSLTAVGCLHRCCKWEIAEERNNNNNNESNETRRQEERPANQAKFFAWLILDGGPRERTIQQQQQRRRQR